MASAAWHATTAATWPTFGLDAEVYRDGGAALLGGRDVYAAALGRESLPFTYPPFALVLFAPLALLPANAAVALLFCLSCVALVVVVRWCQTYALGEPPDTWWSGVALASAAALALEPVRGSLGLGQVNLILLAAVVGLDARGTRVAGVGAGIAAAVKVTPLLLLVAQLVRGDRAAAAKGVAVCAGLTVAGVWAAPREAWVYAARVLWDSSRPGDPAYVSNQSLRGVLARHAGDARMWWIAGSAAVLVLAAVAVRRHRLDPWLSLCAAAVGGLLVSPISWSHHWVWMLPVAAIAWRAGRRRVLGWASGGMVAMAVLELGAWTSDTRVPVLADLYAVAGLLWLAAAAATPAMASSQHLPHAVGGPSAPIGA